MTSPFYYLFSSSKFNSMATPPEKPQQHGPLHNFTLPELKWSKNHSNNLHRGRRLGESSSSQNQSPSVNAAILCFQESLSLQQQPVNLQSQLPDSSLRLSFTFDAGSSSQSQKSLAPESANKALLRPHSDNTVEKSKIDSLAGAVLHGE